MAYRTRSPARRRATGSRSRSGGGYRRPAVRRAVRRAPARGRGGVQTLKLVIEQVPASSIARPEGAPLQKVAEAPKKGRF